MGIYKVGQTGGGGGATVLDDLTDVNTPAPADGEVLTYKNPPGEWQPDTATAVVASLDAVGDVDAPAPNDGDVLTFVNGTGNWEPVAPTVPALDNITDVDAAAPNDGDVLTYVNGTGNWEAVAPTGGGALDDLTDVDAAAPNDGDVLTYVNGSGNWEAVAPNTPAIALDDITDVDAAAPSDGDVLTYVSGSGNWEPIAPTSVRATGPDDPPAVPSVYDDEFTGGSLDAKWTLVTDTVAEKRYATTASWLQAHFTGDQTLVIGQAFVPGASTAFSVTFKFSHTGFNAGSYANCAIVLYADANNYVNFGVQWSGTTKQVRYNRVLAGVSTSVTSRNLSASGHDAMYIHVQRNAGTDYKCWCSTDGVGWFPMRTNEAADSFAPNITELRLSLSQAGQTNYAWAGADWVRVNWLTL